MKEVAPIIESKESRETSEPESDNHSDEEVSNLQNMFLNIKQNKPENNFEINKINYGNTAYSKAYYTSQHRSTSYLKNKKIMELCLLTVPLL